MKRIFKREHGAITIEATISLSVFMFAIVTILTIVNICIVQAKISTAISLTAKELSQYSYLYSLTGFSGSESALHQAGQEGTESINKIMSDVNDMYNEIEKIGETGKETPNNVDDIMTKWDSVVGSAEAIESSAGSIESTIMEIAKDPKGLMFGIAKMAASETLELAKSKLIAAPLAKALVQKHLVAEEDGSVEAYLKSLGVVPDAYGSYLGGLDFSESTLFPYGSNEITVNVVYDVKIVPLLPLDFTFHFNQTAKTNGWLAGDISYKGSSEYVENDTLWIKATVGERVSLIRSMVMKNLEKEGYQRVSAMTNVHMYNPTENEFVTISSMNPLYSAPDEDPMTIEMINKEEIKNSIESLCGKMWSVTEGETKAITKVEQDGSKVKKEHNCTNAKTKVVLVIPEDSGLKEYMESVIAECNTRGVVIELVPSYGTGVNKVVAETPAEGEE